MFIKIRLDTQWNITLWIHNLLKIIGSQDYSNSMLVIYIKLFQKPQEISYLLIKLVENVQPNQLVLK